MYGLKSWLGITVDESMYYTNNNTEQIDLKFTLDSSR